MTTMTQNGLFYFTIVEKKYDWIVYKGRTETGCNINKSREPNNSVTLYESINISKLPVITRAKMATGSKLKIVFVESFCCF